LANTHSLFANHFSRVDRVVNRESIEQLLEACGVQSPMLLDIEQPANNFMESLALDFPFATIGRTASNDVVLDDDQISRRHAYLQVIGGRVFCVDFRSRTGTHRQGGSGNGWLDQGDWLKIGSFVIRVRPMDRSDNWRWPELGDTDPLRTIRTGGDALPQFTLQFLKGVRERSDWKMQRVLALVGSSPQCKVQLVDPRVSRYHCSLLRTPLGTWVMDLLGRGGVRLNGTRVRFAQLQDGDEIQVGGVKIRAECGPPIAPSSRMEVGIAAPLSSVRTETNRYDSGEFQPIVPFLPAAQCDVNLVPRSDSLYGPSSLITNAQGMPPQTSMTDSENLVSTLLHHFGQMQQQMAEQFQQAVMTMVQMFSTFHRDQMELVRGELDRLHDLNQELVTIQNELARRHVPHWQELAPGDSQLITHQSEGELAVSKPSEPIADQAEPLAETVVGHQSPPQAAAPLAAFSVESESVTSESPLPDAPSAQDPSLQAPRGRQRVDQPAAKVARAASADKDPISIAAAPSGEDVHAWLCRRMELIRAEQQTLWQKILTTVRSAVTGGP
jgi:pSer/pThr/pTyr-binding forkhead associated (FHA) protein